jgi:uncharacterized SAM-binding protein YcdF (DUF218 family)
MFFPISKFFGAFLNPALLLTILILLGGVALLIGRRRLVAWCLGLSAVLVILFGILPGGSWLASPLETRFPAEPALPDHVAGIIALAGTERVEASAEWGQPLISDPMPIVAMVALGRRYPDARLIFSGGVHAHAHPAIGEGSIVRDFLVRLGLDPGRITFEEKARNTIESGQFVGALLQPQPGQVWLLVTQALSLPRAVGVYRKAGFDVIAIPAGYLTGSREPGLVSLDLGGDGRLAFWALHEWVGLVVYRLLGYTSELYPG